MDSTLTRRELLQRAKTLTLATPLLCIVGCDEGQPVRRLTAVNGRTMGTTYAVRITDLPSGIDPNELKAKVERILERVNEQMSTYRADSELSRFNARESTSWMEISSATHKVIGAALRTSRLTGGAFDPTIGPLVNLWGFGPAGPRARLPAEERVAEAMSRAGYRKITTRSSSPALRKHEAEIQVDLSGIAKGFGVDEVAALLEESGIGQYLVEIGGELKGRGLNPHGEPWMIGVEKPMAGRRTVQRVVRLDEAALATSGDYRNFFEKDGRRFTHIIDPRSGRPVAHGLASVTVIARSTMEADALSTALMVLGPEAGAELAERHDVAALFIAKQGKRFVEISTGAFRRHVAA